MSLYNPDRFSHFVLSLKAVTLHQQWNAQVAKIGDKFFAALGDQGGTWVDCLIFKTTPDSYLMMLEQKGIKRAPYTKNNWVAVQKDSVLSDAELKIYIARSYEIVAKSLTKKKHHEIGLE